ncbi:MAG: hypothetical protein AAGH90_09080 [Pseudomonadota bacterium]
MDRDLQIMMSRVARLGEMSEEEARRIVGQVYEDGIVSRGEAEALFRLNDQLASADPHWKMRFSEAVKDYVLTREPPEGWVTQEEATWLIAQVDHHGEHASFEEIDLLIHILRYAEGAHESLFDYTMKTVSQRIMADGMASGEMVERMRFLVFARAGDGASWVSRNEALILFQTNDSIAFAKNDPSWNDFFARAVANHLMARAHPNPVSEQEALRRENWVSDKSSSTGGMFAKMAGSFGNGWFKNVTYSSKKAAEARMKAADVANRAAEKVTDDENAWLMKRLGWDGKISPAEEALLKFLREEVPGFVEGLAVAA